MKFADELRRLSAGLLSLVGQINELCAVRNPAWERRAFLMYAADFPDRFPEQEIKRLSKDMPATDAALDRLIQRLLRSCAAKIVLMKSVLEKLERIVGEKEYASSRSFTAHAKSFLAEAVEELEKWIANKYAYSASEEAVRSKRTFDRETSLLLGLLASTANHLRDAARSLDEPPLKRR